jgi:glycosyltransferase involved in cell wall biosynthesis
VAIGPKERIFLSTHLGLRLEDIRMIPLGFDPAVFNHDAERRHALRVERGWSGDTVVAVTGKVNARKRPDLVAAACADAVERGEPVRMVLAGSVAEDARHEIDARAKPLLSCGRLEYLPMLGRQDLADLYRCADVVVFARLPSISIYEAAGTGARVLVGRDEFSEWLNSMLPAIEPVDPFELVQHLVPFDNRAERADQARQAFSWAGLSDLFVELYGAPE